MKSYTYRYTHALNGAAVVAIALAAALILQAVFFSATSAETETESSDWEVWALDQGTDLSRIHVYHQQGDEFVETERIEFAELDDPHNSVQTPHMIDFDDSNRYAAIASTASGTVSIVRTTDYEVIETIETGATAHMALFAPAPDNSIWVANIGAQTFTQITADLENEHFEIGLDIPLAANLQAEGWPGWSEAYGDELEDWPGVVCHEFTPDGRYAYVTMGPMDGGLVVVDVETGEIETAFDPAEVKANCGLALSHNHDQMYANWSGHLADLDHPHDADPAEWYVFDTNTHELVATYSSEGNETAGLDPHGSRVSPDGTEMWQVNRVSNDGIVVDTATQEIIDEFELTDTPDIIGFSPDGEYLFVTLRGPNPASMPHVAVGETPGVEVIDVASRESIAVLQPFDEADAEASDFHGINIRGPIDDPETDDSAPVAITEDTADTDDTEDLVPATGGVNSSTGILAALLATLAAALTGAAAFIRRRSMPSRAT
jgi:DNA-binding beta-propeller fold protein YncE